MVQRLLEASLRQTLLAFVKRLAILRLSVARSWPKQTRKRLQSWLTVALV
jgi:hypothetical protein